MREYGYRADIGETKTWSMNSLPTLADMERYLNNVKIIREAFSTLSTTPYVTDSIKGFTYKEANDIEQILSDVDKLLTNMISVWFFSGDTFSGEV